MLLSGFVKALKPFKIRKEIPESILLFTSVISLPHEEVSPQNYPRCEMLCLTQGLQTSNGCFSSFFHFLIHLLIKLTQYSQKGYPDAQPAFFQEYLNQQFFIP